MEFVDNIMAQIFYRARHFCHVSYYGSNAPYLLICYPEVDSGPTTDERSSQSVPTERRLYRRLFRRKK